MQVPGEPGLHQAPVRPADGDGLQDRPGGPERPGEHPEARRAGGQAGEQRHRSQSLLQPHRGGLWYFTHWSHVVHAYTAVHYGCTDTAVLQKE